MRRTKYPDRELTYDIEQFFGSGHYGNKKSKPKTGTIRYKLKGKYDYRQLRDKIYKFRNYRDLAVAYRREKGSCEECERELASEIHHVTSVYSRDSEYGYFSLTRLNDVSNFLALCPSCHSKKPKVSLRKRRHSRCINCGHELDPAGDCVYCERAYELKKGSRKAKSNNTLKEAILAAEDIIARPHTLEITKLCLKDFVDKAKPHLNSKKIHILDQIRRLIENYPLPTGNKHSNGTVIRFKLMPFQLISMVQVFGNFADIPFKKQVFLTCARKNGKTALSAAFLLAFAQIAPNTGAEIYTAATTEKQALLSLKYAKNILVEMGGTVSKNGTFTSSDGNWKSGSQNIEFLPKRNVISALTANPKTLDGLSPQFLLCDESALMDDACFEVLNTSESMLKGQKFYYISTLGHNEHGFYKKTIDNTKEHLRNDATTTIELLAFCLERDEREIDDEDAWKAVNPAMGVTLSIEDMRNMYQQVIDNPTMRPGFLIKKLNMSGIKELNRLCTPNDAHLTYEAVDRALVEHELETNECVVGIDLALTGATTSICLLTKGRDDHIYTHLKSFINKESYKRKRKGTGTNVLSEFVEREELIVAGDRTIDYDVVMDYLKELDGKYNVVGCISDVCSFGFSIHDLAKKADLSFEVEEHKVVGSKKYFTSNMLVENILRGKIHTTDNRLFAWELLNCCLHEWKNAPGFNGELPIGAFDIVRDKPGSEFSTIDSVMATCHAFLYFMDEELQIASPPGTIEDIAATLQEVFS